VALVSDAAHQSHSSENVGATRAVGQRRTDNLHAVWDSAVLRRAGPTTIADADAVNAEITAVVVTEWSTHTIVECATESEARRTRQPPISAMLYDACSSDADAGHAATAILPF
jgi:hypothetical protein